MSNTPLAGQSNSHHFKRRDFITTSVKAAGATALLGTPVLNMAAKYSKVTKVYTVQDVINIILKEVPGAPFAETVDTVKSGNASQLIGFSNLPFFSTGCKK